MAVNTLCRAFRRITLRKSDNVAGRYYSTRLSDSQQNGLPASLFNLSHPTSTINSAETRIKFIPRTLNIDFGITPHDGIVRNIIETPFKNIPSMDDPLKRRPLKDLPLSDKSLELPTLDNAIEKQAVRLIVIRRKKMKKHQRKKWRKKMHYIRAKERERRNIRKEKALQALLVSKIQEAERFDAKEYVASRIAISKKEFIPKTFRGEILPAFMIKQFIEEKRKKIEARRNKRRLTL